MIGVGELNHLWQSTCFAVVVGLLTFVLRRNRASVRYWLWLIASLKFFIPLAFLMNIGRQLAERFSTQVAAPAVSFTFEQISQPFVYNPGTIPVAPRPSISIAPFVVLALWLAGVITIAVIRFRSWLQVRAAVRGSTLLKIPATVEVRAAVGLLEPGVVGVMRPVLLMPEGITEQLSPSQLEAVLAHELCHVRRRDNLFASIHMIVEILFWFHPLVWWIGARLLEERERACDEEVLRMGNQPRVYADAILNVCKLYAESPLACVSGVSGSDIKRRIEGIMTNRRGQTLNRAKKILLAGAGFAALAGPVAVGIVIGIGHIPAIHAQTPLVAPLLPQLSVPTIAQSIQAPPAPQPLRAGPEPVTTPARVNRYADRRLVAMLFDFNAMTPDDQLRARAAGIAFVQNQMTETDLAAVMLAGGPALSVTQDFTGDAAVLVAAIQRLSAAGNSSLSGADAANARLANIETAAKMLAGFPNKKALMYFSSGITQSGPEKQADILRVVETATFANVAIYPIDAAAVGAIGPIAGTGSFTPGAGAAVPGGRGRGPGRGASPPTGVSQEEYDRRTTYAQTKFGSLNNATSRSYIRYGAPDQIDTPNSGTVQIWRYNYLEDFHGGAAFEFVGNAPLTARIVYPPPMASFEGRGITGSDLAGITPLMDSLTRGQTSGSWAGFPGRHVTVQVYPAAPGGAPAPDRRFVPFSIPLDTLSGQIEIAGQVRTRVDNATGTMQGALRDSVPASAGTYQSGFTLAPGSYVINILLKDPSTGRVFGDTISVDVK